MFLTLRNIPVGAFHAEKSLAQARRDRGAPALGAQAALSRQAAHHRRLRDVCADEGLRLICWPAGRFAAEQNEKAAGNMGRRPSGLKISSPLNLSRQRPGT